MEKEEFQKEVGMGLIRQLYNLRKFMNAYSITIRAGGILSNNEFDELDDILNKTLETIDKNLNKKGL
jgi:hypothetical protein